MRIEYWFIITAIILAFILGTIENIEHGKVVRRFNQDINFQTSPSFIGADYESLFKISPDNLMMNMNTTFTSTIVFSCKDLENFGTMPLVFDYPNQTINSTLKEVCSLLGQEVNK